MQITIKLLAGYRRYLPAGDSAEAGLTREVEKGTRVGAVLDTLPMGGDSALTLLVNGRHATRDQVLRPGDTLAIFPAAGGG